MRKKESITNLSSLFLLTMLSVLALSCGGGGDGTAAVTLTALATTNFSCAIGDIADCDVAENGKNLNVYYFKDATCANIETVIEVGGITPNLQAIGNAVVACAGGPNSCTAAVTTYTDDEANPITSVAVGSYAILAFIDTDADNSILPETGDSILCSDNTLTRASFGPLAADINLNSATDDMPTLVHPATTPISDVNLQCEDSVYGFDDCKVADLNGLDAKVSYYRGYSCADIADSGDWLRSVKDTGTLTVTCVAGPPESCTLTAPATAWVNEATGDNANYPVGSYAVVGLYDVLPANTNDQIGDEDLVFCKEFTEVRRAPAARDDDLSERADPPGYMTTFDIFDMVDDDFLPIMKIPPVNSDCDDADLTAGAVGVANPAQCTAGGLLGDQYTMFVPNETCTTFRGKWITDSAMEDGPSGASVPAVTVNATDASGTIGATDWFLNDETATGMLEGDYAVVSIFDSTVAAFNGDPVSNDVVACKTVSLNKADELTTINVDTATDELIVPKIATLTFTCTEGEDAGCAVGNDGDNIYGFITDETCADLFAGPSPAKRAGTVEYYTDDAPTAATCTDNNPADDDCTGTVNDWYVDIAPRIPTSEKAYGLTAGTYAVAAYFDFNGSGAEPDAGDRACCVDVALAAEGNIINIVDGAVGTTCTTF